MSISVAGEFTLEHRQPNVEGSSIHVVQGGSRSNRAILFLHGWPQSWAAFERVMMGLAVRKLRCLRMTKSL